MRFSTIPDEVDNSVNGAHLLNSPPKETPPMPEFRGGETSLIQPLVMQFSIVLQRLSITAALLPSLQAQYQMEQVVSAGMTGSKAKFTVDLPRHSLSFTTKLQITENLPPSASIELPQVHVGAEYLQDSAKTEEFVDGVVLCRGNYLSAEAEIGTFEHCLTTDLLNHLVFVQKVFMAEVNDVLIKVSGGDKPVPLWEESDQPNPSTIRLLLYNLIVRLKGNLHSINFPFVINSIITFFFFRYSDHSDDSDQHGRAFRNRPGRTTVIQSRPERIRRIEYNGPRNDGSIGQEISFVVVATSQTLRTGQSRFEPEFGAAHPQCPVRGSRTGIPAGGLLQDPHQPTQCFPG